MHSGVTSESLCLPLYLMKKNFSWDQYQYAWSLGSRLRHSTVRYLNSPCFHHYPSPFWEISKLFLFSHPRQYTFTLARSPLQLETQGKVSRKHDYILFHSPSVYFFILSFILIPLTSYRPSPRNRTEAQPAHPYGPLDPEKGDTTYGYLQNSSQNFLLHSITESSLNKPASGNNMFLITVYKWVPQLNREELTLPSSLWISSIWGHKSHHQNIKNKQQPYAVGSCGGPDICY